MVLRLDGSYSRKVHRAYDALVRALKARGIELQDDDGREADILAGTPAGSSRVSVPVPELPESLAMERAGNTLVVAGRDEQGLMYGLYELADQVALGGAPLRDVKPVNESPETSFRGMYTFLHNADCEREWFTDAEHWEAYFRLLARSRYNSFHLVMAHQTAYLAPPFPFFVDVPEHPEVSVPSLDAGERERNLAALRMIGRLAADHGLAFVVGIWEVIAWKPETRHGTHTQRSMVDGLDWGNLEAYTYHATTRLLAECPEITGIQLRVNPESGVPPQKQTAFFRDSVFAAIAEADRSVLLDLRGWHAHPATIDAAKRLGIPMRLSMKYWAEHLGAPYQAPLQNPAYSYADFLRYPRGVPVSYQVWALGSHRHFVWGDPDYVATFSRSLRLGDGIGFEVCPQLAQKGYGNEPGAWRVLKREHEYYRWEWERYWLYHLLFGRLTYNSDTPEDVWMRELRSRFGRHALEVMEAYTSASRVVSLIIRFNMSDPNMYIWPEGDTGGLLDFYTAVPPSDPARIASFSETVRERLTGEWSARNHPREAGEYLRGLGQQCVEKGRTLRDLSGGNRELAATAADVEALGELALYHAEKIPAAEDLALYYASGDYGALVRATRQLPKAAPHWERLAAVTDEFYTDRQVTGPIDSGHWKHKTLLVREDEERLRERVELHRRYAGAARAFDFGGVPALGSNYSRIPELYRFHVEQGFTGVDGDARKQRGKPHGWQTDAPLRSVAAPAARFCDWHLDTHFRDTMEESGFENLTPFTDELYRDYVGGAEPATFIADVPAGHYEVVLVFCDRSCGARDHGPFSVTVNDRRVADALTTRAGEYTEIRGVHELGRARLAVSFEADSGADWFVSALVVRPLKPSIYHVPVRFTDATTALSMRAAVSAPQGIREVLLVLQADTATTRTAMDPVEENLLYGVEIPASTLRSAQRLEYWFEATAADGRTSRLPARTERRRAFPITVYDGTGRPPEIKHTPVHQAVPGTDIAVAAEVSAQRQLQAFRIHYRYANQYYEWQVVDYELAPDGRTGTVYIPGDYVIPEWDIMYYLEAVDDVGRGTFWPKSDWVHTIPYQVVRVGR